MQVYLNYLYIAGLLLVCSLWPGAFLDGINSKGGEVVGVEVTIYCDNCRKKEFNPDRAFCHDCFLEMESNLKEANQQIVNLNNEIDELLYKIKQYDKAAKLLAKITE